MANLADLQANTFSLQKSSLSIKALLVLSINTAQNAVSRRSKERERGEREKFAEIRCKRSLWFEATLRVLDRMT